jgi:hypothetical protein
MKKNTLLAPLQTKTLGSTALKKSSIKKKLSPNNLPLLLLLKKATRLLKKATRLLKKATRLLKKATRLLKKATRLLKKATRLLPLQTES